MSPRLAAPAFWLQFLTTCHLEIFFPFKKIFLFCMYELLFECMSVAPSEAREGMKSPGTGSYIQRVSGRVAAGNWTCILHKSNQCSNHWPTSPAPINGIFQFDNLATKYFVFQGISSSRRRNSLCPYLSQFPNPNRRTGLATVTIACQTTLRKRGSRPCAG